MRTVETKKPLENTCSWQVHRLTFSPRTRTFFIDPCARGISVHRYFSLTPHLSLSDSIQILGRWGGESAVLAYQSSLAENWSIVSVILRKRHAMRYSRLISPCHTCSSPPNLNQKNLALLSNNYHTEMPVGLFSHSFGIMKQSTVATPLLYQYHLIKNNTRDVWQVFGVMIYSNIVNNIISTSFTFLKKNHIDSLLLITIYLMNLETIIKFF